MDDTTDARGALATAITEQINRALESGRADRGDAIVALHIVLARVTRSLEEDSARRPDIAARLADNPR